MAEPAAATVSAVSRVQAPRRNRAGAAGPMKQAATSMLAYTKAAGTLTGSPIHFDQRLVKARSQFQVLLPSHPATCPARNVVQAK